MTSSTHPQTENVSVSSCVESWRLFAAISLPESLAAVLTDHIAEWRKSVVEGGGRWVRPNQYHLTLKFFGDIELDSLPDLREAIRLVVRAFLPFHLRQGGFGVFPGPRRPRVLWIGFEEGVDQIIEIQKAVESATEKWASREKRPFFPHLTLARFSAPNSKLVQQLNDLKQRVKMPILDRWPVFNVTLFRSQLTDNGARYSIVEEFPLKKIKANA